MGKRASSFGHPLPYTQQYDDWIVLKYHVKLTGGTFWCSKIPVMFMHSPIYRCSRMHWRGAFVTGLGWATRNDKKCISGLKRRWLRGNANESHWSGLGHHRPAMVGNRREKILRGPQRRPGLRPAYPMCPMHLAEMASKTAMLPMPPMATTMTTNEYYAQ